MKKKSITILAISLLLATFFVGCGKSAEKETSANVSVEVSTNEEPTKEESEVVAEEKTAADEETVNYKADPNGTCVDPNEFAKLIEKYGQNPFWDVYGTGYKKVDTAFTDENQCSVLISDVYEATPEFKDELMSAMKQEAENYKEGLTEGPNGYCIKLQKDENHYYEYYFYTDDSCCIYITITASKGDMVPDWIDDFAIEAGIWSK